MKRLLAEWLWRAAIVCALGWIGWELHALRMDLQQPDDEATTAAAPEDIQDSIDVFEEDEEEEVLPMKPPAGKKLKILKTNRQNSAVKR